MDTRELYTSTNCGRAARRGWLPHRVSASRFLAPHASIRIQIAHAVAAASSVFLCAWLFAFLRPIIVARVRNRGRGRQVRLTHVHARRRRRRRRTLCIASVERWRRHLREQAAYYLIRGALQNITKSFAIWGQLTKCSFLPTINLPAFHPHNNWGGKIDTWKWSGLRKDRLSLDLSLMSILLWLFVGSRTSESCGKCIWRRTND